MAALWGDLEKDELRRVGAQVLEALEAYYDDLGRRKVFPDVSPAEGHLGRGGWTWYTGSASWMYRIGLEGILGLEKRGNSLHIQPRAPAAWQEYQIEYRFGGSTYAITVRRDAGTTSVVAAVDGTETPDGSIPLVDDGRRHDVVVRRPAT